jgi:endoglucanase
VLVGEFGGPSLGSDADGVWQRKLVSFLSQEGFSYTYWVWNQDAWIGGLLQNDRGGLDQAKMTLLRSTQAPMLGQPAQ